METRVAVGSVQVFGTAEQRNTSRVCDFYSGLPTSITDLDNSVTQTRD